jgi:succinoglycan biosynthesis transport protein ExoP
MAPYRQPSSTKDFSNELLPFLYAKKHLLQFARVIALYIISGLIIALTYLLTALPNYQSSTQLSLDKTDNTQSSVNQLYEEIDPEWLYSQIEVIKSQRVITGIFETLNQDEIAVISDTNSILSSMLKQFDIFDSLPELSQADLVSKIEDDLFVRRIPKTNNVLIRYQSHDASLSRKIPYLIGQSYLNEFSRSQQDALLLSSKWINARKLELKEISQNAALALQQFKTQNGLQFFNGSDLVETRLAEMNSVLVSAKTQLFEAEAKLDQIQFILSDFSIEKAVPEAFAMGVLREVRSEYLDTKKLIAELTSTLPQGHDAIRNTKQDLVFLEQNAKQELKRLEAVYISNTEILKDNIDNLERQISVLIESVSLNNEIYQKFNQLETDAQIYELLYRSYLDQYNEIMQEISFKPVPATILSLPQSQEKKISPKPSVIIASGIMLGFILGLIVSLWKAYHDRTINSENDILADNGLSFLGYIPLFKASDKVSYFLSRHRSRSSSKPLSDFEKFQNNNTFIETLRSLKLTQNDFFEDCSCPVLGFISVMPGEGKSSLSKLYADFLVHTDMKVLLIDADFHNSSLSKSFGQDESKGIQNLVLENGRVQDFVVKQKGGTYFLPIAQDIIIPHPTEFLLSPKASFYFDQMKELYNCIIVDLPPAGLFRDATALSEIIDGYICIAEWGRTPKALLQKTLQKQPLLRQKTIGVLINKTNPKKLAIHDPERAYLTENYYSLSYGEVAR